MTPAERAAVMAVRETGDDLIHTIRELALFELPSQPYLRPPCDIEAEAAVLEALLNGRRKPAELACRATDFFLPIHTAIAAVVEAQEELGHDLNVDHIAQVLALQGAPVERTTSYLVRLRDEEPMRVCVEELAERVHEFACRRRFMERMQRIDAAWRIGANVPAEDIEQLMEAAKRWRT